MKDWNEMTKWEQVSYLGYTNILIFVFALVLTGAIAARGGMFSVVTAVIVLLAYISIESKKTRSILASELIKCGK